MTNALQAVQKGSENPQNCVRFSWHSRFQYNRPMLITQIAFVVSEVSSAASSFIGRRPLRRIGVEPPLCCTIAADAAASCASPITAPFLSGG
jgi:hypothetical protein